MWGLTRGGTTLRREKVWILLNFLYTVFANMSCLHIHLVTLFNLPGKNIFVME